MPAGEPDAFARAMATSVRVSGEARDRIATRNRACVATRANLSTNLPRLLRILRVVAGQSRGVPIDRLAFAV